ncbi:UNVERIFIED_CONTAM: 8-hydroxygeraniol oxidoreductase [Sesamum radiatum]|uniref:Eukaryotic translation initiation factor 3 subunit L n=1 Tax=Sesamum radiatum TaxID=300843 RepID=A0AAW2KZP9_SESRA
MAGATSYDHDLPVPGESPSTGYDPNFVPDSVKSFVVHMYRHIREKNVYEIHQMYENSFQSISDRLFKDSPWPSVDAVAPYVDNDHVFCLLYREMWFRHLYARLSPTPKQRIDSWDNYCSLFQVVLHGVVNMQLPNQWLWDMMDEFVYQFQSFCQYRAKMKNKTEQEIALLRQYDQAWNVYGVLNFLQALVEKSMIIQILEQEKEGLEQFTATDGYDYSGGSNVLKVLGYFSMIGLLRVHCLLGDYHTGLKCLVPIDISQQGVYTSVIGSHITTIYHYGFANLMLRRYVEAIREFNKILVYIFKTKQYHQKSPQYEQILKKNEQMYALLAISLSLCPQVKLVEETVNSQLREKYGEKMLRMQRYDDEAFALYDELFSYACPKFITPAPPSYEEPLVNYNQDAYRLQLKLFLYEVKQQQLLTILMTYKHKTHSVDSDGKITSNADIDFYIDDDMIHVFESKPAKRNGDYFMRQIVKVKSVSIDRASAELNDLSNVVHSASTNTSFQSHRSAILQYHSRALSYPLKCGTSMNLSLDKQPMLFLEAADTMSNTAAPAVISCKAAVIRKSGEPLRVEEIQVDPPKSTEVRIKMLCASMCHTDILYCNGFQHPIFPRIPGHEGVGVVESIGDKVTHINVGDTVMPLYLGECGECLNCSSGRTNFCHKYPLSFSGLMPDGTSRLSAGGERIYHLVTCSTWAEYAVIDANYTIKVDPRLSLPHASFLCCGFTTGFGSTWREVNVEKGSTVAVIGLGAVGLGAVKGAQTKGASKIIGIDINEFKHEKAKAFGITDFINPKLSDKSVSELIKAATEGLGVDYCIECTGVPALLNEAIEGSKVGLGTVVLVGAGLEPSGELNYLPLLCGRTVKGSIYGGVRAHSDLPKIVEKCVNKEIDLDELITHEVSLAEINKAFEYMKQPDSVKIVIKF